MEGAPGGHFSQCCILSEVLCTLSLCSKLGQTGCLATGDSVLTITLQSVESPLASSLLVPCPSPPQGRASLDSSSGRWFVETSRRSSIHLLEAGLEAAGLLYWRTGRAKRGMDCPSRQTKWAVAMESGILGELHPLWKMQINCLFLIRLP